MPIAASFDTFQPYSALHAAVVVVLAGLTAVAVALAWRWRGTPRARRLDQALACICFAAWIWTQTFGALPGRWDASKALPLHVCDVVGLIVAIMLWTKWRSLRAIAYFWGLGLSTQGFFQPDLREGPADPSFWVFWTGHVAIVGAALYDLIGRGYRPTWRDYGVACAALVVYVMFILPINMATGFNYGYIGKGKSNQPSVVDFFGPWPGRLAIIFSLVALVLALMILPWDIARRLRARRPSPPVDEPAAKAAPTECI